MADSTLLTVTIDDQDYEVTHTGDVLRVTPAGAEDLAETVSLSHLPEDARTAFDTGDTPDLSAAQWAIAHCAADRCAPGQPSSRPSLALACSVSSVSLPLKPFSAMPTASSSPYASPLVTFFIIGHRTCGGSDAICGSVQNSSSTGPSADSARSHAGPTSSGRSILMPSKPSSFAYSA